MIPRHARSHVSTVTAHLPLTLRLLMTIGRHRSPCRRGRRAGCRSASRASMDQPRLQEDRVACRQRLPCRGTASARALETSSLSAHVQSISDVFGDNFSLSFSRERVGASRRSEFGGTHQHVLSATKPIAASCGGPHERRSQRKSAALWDVRCDRKCPGACSPKHATSLNWPGARQEGEGRCAAVGRKAPFARGWS